MFTGDEEHEISLEDAAALTARYRAQMASGQIKGGFFGKTAISKLITESGAVGFRYYYGLDEDEKQVLVLIAVNADGTDIVDGIVLEFSLPCPTYCGFPPSALDS